MSEAFFAHGPRLGRPWLDAGRPAEGDSPHLAEIVARHLEDAHFDQWPIDRVVVLGRDGTLHDHEIDEETRPPPWVIADLLRRDDAECFWAVSDRWDDAVLLLGDRAGRSDAVLHRTDGGWQDEAAPCAHAYVRAVVGEWLGTAPAPRVYLSLEADGDFLEALEFGRVSDGQPEGAWLELASDVGLLEDDGQRPVSFVTTSLASYDPDSEEHAFLWTQGPRFDAPQLGLGRATVNEIVVAARALYGDQDSLNRRLFGVATTLSDREEALGAWLACLQSGDHMAHFALGYTLLELGRTQEAYRHLRHYTAISPGNGWNWTYRARAALALGLSDEALQCLERAVAEDERLDPEERSDAAERLERLRGEGSP